jgi:hypothetical protein
MGLVVADVADGGRVKAGQCLGEKLRASSA